MRQNEPSFSCQIYQTYEQDWTSLIYSCDCGGVVKYISLQVLPYSPPLPPLLLSPHPLLSPPPGQGFIAR